MNAPGGPSHKDEVMEVLNAALAAADPYRAVVNGLIAERLVDRDMLTSLSPDGKIYLVGAGKAGAAMARAAQDVLGERIAGGLVIIKDGPEGIDRRWSAVGGGSSIVNRPSLVVRLAVAG